MAFFIYGKFLICTILAVVLCGTTAAPVSGSCNILSDVTGKYLVVPSSGPIHANGNANDAADFDITYPGIGKIEFQVAGTSDYLLIDNGVLTTGNPSGGNSEFDFIEESTYDAFKISPDCYVAFDGTGAVHGPCGLTQGDDETKMSLTQA